VVPLVAEEEELLPEEALPLEGELLTEELPDAAPDPLPVEADAPLVEDVPGEQVGKLPTGAGAVAVQPPPVAEPNWDTYQMYHWQLDVSW